jgi:integrase/recombinase XerD
MASLRVRKDRDNKFELEYTDPSTGQRYRINTGTVDKKVAALWKSTAENRISLVRLGQLDKVGKITINHVQNELTGEYHERGTAMTLREFKAYNEEQCRTDDSRDYAPSTLALMGNAFDSLILAIGNKPLKAVDEAKILKWKKDLKSQGKSMSTISIYQRALRAAFNRGMKEWKVLDANPFVDIKMPRCASRDHMPFDDVKMLLASISVPWFGDYVRFLLYTGCRRNEILFLQTQDIDMERWVLEIRSQKTKRRMELPINNALQRVIQNMNLSEGYVFESDICRGQPWNEDSVTHRFKRELRIAGLPEIYTPHSLRHTYATFLRKKGVPRDIISTLIGHTSPITTAIYDDSDALYFRDQANLVDFEAEE